MWAVWGQESARFKRAACKSWAALAVADYIMNGRFDIKLHLFFRIRDFITAVREGKIQKGDCVVLDEMGIAFSSRASMTKTNRSLSSLFQIMRFMNFAVIMTVPSFKLIDVVARDSINVSLQTLSINREKGYCICKYITCRHNPIIGKTYGKFVRLYVNDQKKVFKRVRIWAPRKELIDEYEKAKRLYAKGEHGLFQEIDDLLNLKQTPQIQKQGIPLTCHRCSHEWDYTGKRQTARCPSCNSYVAAAASQ